MPAAGRSQLSVRPTRFVGRTVELAAFHLHVQGDARLLTVVGGPGFGKTRFVTEYLLAHREELTSAGGFWFCDLTETRTADDVSAAVAATLGLARSGPLTPASDQVGSALAARGRVLVVLDNFE